MTTEDLEQLEELEERLFVDAELEEEELEELHLLRATKRAETKEAKFRERIAKAKSFYRIPRVLPGEKDWGYNQSVDGYLYALEEEALTLGEEDAKQYVDRVAPLQGEPSINGKFFYYEADKGV